GGTSMSRNFECAAFGRRAAGRLAGAVALALLAQGPLDAQQPARSASAPASQPTRARSAPSVPAAQTASAASDLQSPPATNAAGLYAIQNAKIVTLAGPAIDRGTIVIERGKIKAVGANVAIPAGAEIVNGEGLQVYPGLFDSIS